VKSHFCAAKRRKFLIQVALDDFGEANFCVSEIFLALSKTDLDWAEKHFIAELKPKYNATAGGAGVPGRKTSCELRQKRSENAKKRWADFDWREKTVAALKKAHNTDEARERGRKLALSGGVRRRWEGHVKQKREPADRSQAAKNVWAVHGDKMRAALRESANRPEVKAKVSARMLGKVHPPEILARIARQKWKPVYCPQLQTTFLSRKFAAEYFDVVHSSISNALKNKSRVAGIYTFEEVA
jgi:hypothetical protein